MKMLLKMATTNARKDLFNWTAVNEQELVFSVLSSPREFLYCSNCLTHDVLDEMLEAVRDNEMRPIENLFETKTLWTALVLLSSKY